MSDNVETIETDETTAPAETTTESTHTFNVGDEASVVRGKYRGQKATILKHNSAQKTYAVELEDGTFTVVNSGNLKAPVDSTVSVRALVGVLASFQSTDPDVIGRLAAALDAVAPGVSVKLNEATAA